jgi:hypothetical protein
MQFTRVNSNPDETNGLLGVIDKVGLTVKGKSKNEVRTPGILLLIKKYSCE